MRVGLFKAERQRSSAGNVRRRTLASLAAVLVVPVAVGFTQTATVSAAPVAHAAPVAAQAPVATQAPGGATIHHVDWLTDRRVAIWINSPSMGVPIQVQMLLARDWNSKPTEKFPSVYMLDGLRAQDNENGWTLETDAESFFADKNINVVLPVGGQSSFWRRRRRSPLWHGWG